MLEANPPPAILSGLVCPINGLAPVVNTPDTVLPRLSVPKTSIPLAKEAGNVVPGEKVHIDAD